MFDIILEAWRHPGAECAPIYKVKLPLENTDGEISRLHRCGVDAILIYSDADTLPDGAVGDLLEAASHRHMLVYVSESCIAADAGCSDVSFTGFMPLFSERMLRIVPTAEGTSDGEELLLRANISESGEIIESSDGVYSLYLSDSGSGRLDILNPDAAESYIFGAYEAFAEKYKDHFASTVAGVVTDRLLSLAKRKNEGCLLWSYELEREFYNAGGSAQMLVALLMPGRSRKVESEAMRLYSQVLASRADSAFFTPLSDWCVRKNIDLCGPVPYEFLSSCGKCFSMPFVSADKMPKDVSSVVRADIYVKAVSDIARHSGGRGAAVELLNCDLVEGLVRDACDAAVCSAAAVVLPENILDPLKLETLKASAADMKAAMEYISRHFTVNSACRILPESGCAVMIDDGFIPFSGSEKLKNAGVGANYISKAQLLERAHIHGSEIHIDKYSYGALILDPRIRLTPSEVLRIGSFAAGGGELLRGSGFDGFAKKLRAERYKMRNGISHLDTVKSGIGFTLLMSDENEDVTVSLPALPGCAAYLLDPVDPGKIMLFGARDVETFNVTVPTGGSAVVAFVPDKGEELPEAEELPELELCEVLSLRSGENRLPRTIGADESAFVKLDRIDGKFCTVVADGCSCRLMHRPFVFPLKAGVNKVNLESDGLIFGARLEIWRRL